MSTKYHLSPGSGNPAICHASVRGCPLGADDTDHYANADLAREAFEKKNYKNLFAVQKKMTPTRRNEELYKDKAIEFQARLENIQANGVTRIVGSDDEGSELEYLNDELQYALKNKFDHEDIDMIMTHTSSAIQQMKNQIPRAHVLHSNIGKHAGSIPDDFSNEDEAKDIIANIERQIGILENYNKLKNPYSEDEKIAGESSQIKAPQTSQLNQPYGGQSSKSTPNSESTSNNNSENNNSITRPSSPHKVAKTYTPEELTNETVNLMVKFSNKINDPVVKAQLSEMGRIMKQLGTVSNDEASLVVSTAASRSIVESVKNGSLPEEHAKKLLKEFEVIMEKPYESNESFGARIGDVNKFYQKYDKSLKLYEASKNKSARSFKGFNENKNRVYTKEEVDSLVGSNDSARNAFFNGLMNAHEQSGGGSFETKHGTMRVTGVGNGGINFTLNDKEFMGVLDERNNIIAVIDTPTVNSRIF